MNQKEVMFNDGVPANFEKVTYSISPVSFTIYSKENKTYEQIEEYLDCYARRADYNLKEPRKFTAEFDDSHKSITFKHDVKQAVELLSDYWLLSEKAQNEILKSLDPLSQENRGKNSFFKNIFKNIINNTSSVQVREKKPLLNT